MVGSKGAEWSCVHVLALTPRSHLWRAHPSKSGSCQRTEVMLTSSTLTSDGVLRPVREGQLEGADTGLGWSGTGEAEADGARSAADVVPSGRPTAVGVLGRGACPWSAQWGVGSGSGAAWGSEARAGGAHRAAWESGQGSGRLPGQGGLGTAALLLCVRASLWDLGWHPPGLQSPGPSGRSAKNKEGTEGSQICASAPKALGAGEQPNGAGKGRGHLPDGAQSRASSTEPPWADFPHCFGGASLPPAMGRASSHLWAGGQGGPLSSSAPGSWPESGGPEAQATSSHGPPRPPSPGSTRASEVWAGWSVQHRC